MGQGKRARIESIGTRNTCVHQRPAYINNHMYGSSLPGLTHLINIKCLKKIRDECDDWRRIS